MESIEKILESINDITDPRHMNDLKVCLDEIQLEDDIFMDNLVSKLGQMFITWEQPWYQQIKSLTRPLENKEESESLRLREKESFRTDSFTKEERDHIEKRWKKFIKKYDVPNKPISLARWKNKFKLRKPYAPEEKARRFVMAFLAKGLKRNLYQVNLYFIAHYATPKQGPFTKTEDKAIDYFLYHKPDKMLTFLSIILGRNNGGIRKRIKIKAREKQPSYKKAKWSPMLATKLVKSLMKHSGKKFHKLKNSKFSPEVWREVQKDTGIDQEYLERFWKKILHVQLFVKYDVKLRSFRKKLLKILRASPYKVWRDIRWENILKGFPDGFTYQFLYYNVYTLIRDFSKTIPESPLQDIVDYGLNILRTKNIYKKRLKMLTLNENGNLETVFYDEKLPLKSINCNFLFDGAE